MATLTELDARSLGTVRRYFAAHPVAADVLVVTCFALPEVIGAMTVRFRPDTLLLVALGSTLLMLRRHRPVPVAAAIGLLAVVSLAWTGGLSGFDLALGFAVYAVAAARPPRVAWLTTGALVTVVAWGSWLWEEPHAGGSGLTLDGAELPSETTVRVATLTGLTLIALVAMAIGVSVHQRRLHIADLVERAARLEADRDQQARLARAEERGRIAREMHDVVAHSVSVMVALADGASAALDRAPDRSRAALGELSETGRTALADMRRVLGMLDGDGAPLGPQPGCPDIGELIDRVRAAGVPVTSTGLDSLPSDAGLELTVHRVVQEALTNVLRHAPGTTAVTVDVRTTGTAVQVEVVDQGPGPGSTVRPGSGRGLVGMRERAAVYGGDVENGPHGSGWRVLVTLPWEGDGA